MEPPPIAARSEMTEKQFESHAGLAMGLGAGVGASTNMGVGAALAVFYLALTLGRTGWSEEKKRSFRERRGRTLLLRLVIAFVVLACLKAIYDNWDAFKQGVVDGYRAIRGR